MESRIGKAIEAEVGELREIRRDLHAHPRLAFEEDHAAEVIRRELTRAGVPFAAGLAGTGIVGWIVPPGVEGRAGIAFRADMDALPIEERTGLPHASKIPGRMHACGHDGHMAVLLGAARVLAKMRGALPRPVKLIFQPAEEPGEGAKGMIEAGALGAAIGGFPLEAIFGLHGWPQAPLGTVAVRPGPFLASTDAFRIRVEGKGGHASAPQDAADPIVAASHIVTALQSIPARDVSPFAQAVITVASIHAGQADNVIPSSATMTGTIRALDEGTAAILCRRLREVAEMTARALRCSAAVEVRRRVAVCANDPGATRRLIEAAGEALGPERVVEFERAMGSEDFAFYGALVPACFFFLGLGPPGGRPGPLLHTAEFDFDDAAIPAGVAVFCRLALKEVQGAPHDDPAAPPAR